MEAYLSEFSFLHQVVALTCGANQLHLSFHVMKQT